MEAKLNRTILAYNTNDNTVVDYSGCKYETDFIHNDSMNFEEANKLLKGFLFRKFNITDDDIFYPTNMVCKIRDFKINQILSE